MRGLVYRIFGSQN